MWTELFGGIVAAAVDGALKAVTPEHRLAEFLPTDSELAVLGGSLIFYWLAKYMRLGMLEKLGEGSVLYTIPVNLKRLIVRGYYVLTK